MLTEAQIAKEEQQWDREKDLIKRKNRLRQEKRQLRQPVSTTKLIIAFLFISCTLIEIFTGWVTIQSLALSMVTGLPVDFSPLVGLIGAVVGEVFGFGIYALKSLKENTANGIVYELAMKNSEPKG